MRWVLGMKELARIRECVKIGEIFFGLKEKRGCKGERGDGREERERWSEFEERCGEVELHCRWLLRWQWLSGVLKIGGLKKNVIGMKRHRLFDEVGLSFYIENGAFRMQKETICIFKNNF